MSSSPSSLLERAEQKKIVEVLCRTCQLLIRWKDALVPVENLADQVTDRDLITYLLINAPLDVIRRICLARVVDDATRIVMLKNAHNVLEQQQLIDKIHDETLLKQVLKENWICGHRARKMIVKIKDQQFLKEYLISDQIFTSAQQSALNAITDINILIELSLTSKTPVNLWASQRLKKLRKQMRSDSCLDSVIKK